MPRTWDRTGPTLRPSPTNEDRTLHRVHHLAIGAGAPGRAKSERIEDEVFNLDDFVNDFINGPEEPPAKRQQIGSSGRDTPLVSVGGVSPEN